MAEALEAQQRAIVGLHLKKGHLIWTAARLPSTIIPDTDLLQKNLLIDTRRPQEIEGIDGQPIMMDDFRPEVGYDYDTDRLVVLSDFFDADALEQRKLIYQAAGESVVLKPQILMPTALEITTINKLTAHTGYDRALPPGELRMRKVGYNLDPVYYDLATGSVQFVDPEIEMGKVPSDQGAVLNSIFPTALASVTVQLELLEGQDGAALEHFERDLKSGKKIKPDSRDTSPEFASELFRYLSQVTQKNRDWRSFLQAFAVGDFGQILAMLNELFLDKDIAIMAAWSLARAL